MSLIHLIISSRQFEKLCVMNLTLLARTLVRLPNIAGSVAYYLDSFIQSVGLYNKEIHVLSEMNKTIACSIKRLKMN